MCRQEVHSPQGSPSSRLFSQLSAIARTRASVVLPTPRGPQRRYPCATRPRAIAPRSVLDTCDWTATSENLRGRYLRARATDIGGREYPRPDGATKDTTCRCYLRGPDGVSGLAPSGTWGTSNISRCDSVRERPDTKKAPPEGGALSVAHRESRSDLLLLWRVDLDGRNLDRGGVLLHLDLGDVDRGRIRSNGHRWRRNRVGLRSNDRLLNFILTFTGLLAGRYGHY